jgi:hypothetical protein
MYFSKSFKSDLDINGYAPYLDKLIYVLWNFGYQESKGKDMFHSARRLNVKSGNINEYRLLLIS